MGLTNTSTGTGAINRSFDLRHKDEKEAVVALAGNPNVGKSTVFNALTGMHQHTGNWPGKTVACACGHCRSKASEYLLVDVPGAYSLLAHSAEEEVARNFICFGDPDVTVIVCDATCLSRNLTLVLQILECTSRVIVCVNLLDEAARKGITVDLVALEEHLGVPVVGVVARRNKSLAALLERLDGISAAEDSNQHRRLPYCDAVEAAIGRVECILQEQTLGRLDRRWVSVMLLDGDESLIAEIGNYLGGKSNADTELMQALNEARDELNKLGMDQATLRDELASAAVREAEMISREVVHRKTNDPHAWDRRLDRILTGRKTAIPIMLLLLMGIFWLTIYGANYPSQWLASGFAWISDRLQWSLLALDAPPWLCGLLVDGILGVLFRVISVMLPPMAIFFPLFTLLEDAGYLPRVAYNLDRPFARCNACGKQSLCMWLVGICMQKIVIKESTVSRG